MWRVNQSASHLCDSFDGLLLNASTARGNFCVIRMEVSLYYVCDRIFSLVTLLYVQRITCGNLWIRMLKTFFVKASDRPNLWFCEFRFELDGVGARINVDEFGGFCRMIWLGFRCLQISDFRSACCWWCITFWIVLWLFTEQNFLIKEFFGFRAFNQFWPAWGLRPPFKQGQSPTDTAGVTEVARQPRSSEAKFEVRTVSNI